MRQDAKPSRSSEVLPAGELTLIERIRLRAEKFRSDDVRLGIGDDCAILQPRPGEELVVTTDFSIEGRHFRRDWHPAASVGHRAMARGLSDIASMGARPVAAFLSLALSRSVANDNRWVDEFLDGLLALAAQHGVALAGGDTSESPDENVLADIVLIGATPTGTALRRSGARPGDILYCTGQLGGSAMELAQLEARPPSFRLATCGDALHPHLYPEPRLAVGMTLRERGLATACIDLSDGLSTDLAHLCRASSLSAEVDYDALPHASALRHAEPEFAESAVLHGGEDYELLFTASPETKVPQIIAGVSITRIGKLASPGPEGSMVQMVRSGAPKQELKPGGWEHLSK